MGNIVDIGKQAYWARKKQRKMRQEAVLAQIQNMDFTRAAEVLFEKWPEHLPKVFRGKLDPRVRSEWNRLNFEAWMERNFPEELYALNCMEMENHLSDLAEASVKRHASMIEGLIEAMGQGIRGKASFSISTVVPKPGVKYNQLMSFEPEKRQNSVVRISFHGHYSKENGVVRFTDCQGRNIDSQVRCWMGLAMNLSGGMSITEELTLRRMIKNEQGDDVWVPQLRNYCVSMNFGEWVANTAKEAAEANSYDHETGEALPSEPGLSYGQLKKPSWLNKVQPNTDHLALKQ